MGRPCSILFFFFNDTATTEIYTLSLHDALPISVDDGQQPAHAAAGGRDHVEVRAELDRKSTRLNSSHSQISYAVFCLKKKKKKRTRLTIDAIPKGTLQRKCPATVGHAIYGHRAA